MNNATTLEIVGHPGSQPARTVFWACAIHATPFRVSTDLGEHLATLNPRGQVPALRHNGLHLFEMPAMLCYLAEEFGWSHYYPTDRIGRARIHQYLHAHPTLTRVATLKLMAPHVLVAFNEPPLDNPLSVLNNEAIRTALHAPDKLAHGTAAFDPIAQYLEAHWFNLGDFIAGTAAPTIADLACYEELAQLPWANLYHFHEQPRITAWLARMRELPHHDALHAFNHALGDVATQPNTLDRFMQASSAGIAGLTTVASAVLA